MEANELRIGNIITVNTITGEDKEIRVNSIRKQFDDLCIINETWDVDNIQPIPLTEEWLVKFGFEEDLSKLDPPETPNGNFWSEWVKGDVIISMPFYSFIWNYGECEIDLKHVHQLQNLYFSLIGKELEISE